MVKVMVFKPIITLIAAAIALSYFMPWLSPGGSAPFAPHEAFSAAAQEDVLALAEEVLVFLCTFALAGMLALFALFGWAPRALALLVAILPVSFFALLYADALELDKKLGLPLPDFKTYEQAWETVFPIADVGFWFYFGGAAALLIVVLIDPGENV